MPRVSIEFESTPCVQLQSLYFTASSAYGNPDYNVQPPPVQVASLQSQPYLGHPYAAVVPQVMPPVPGPAYPNYGQQPYSAPYGGYGAAPMAGGLPSSPLNDPSYYNPPKPKAEVTLDVDPFSFVKGTMAPPAAKSTQMAAPKSSTTQPQQTDAFHSSGFNGSIAAPSETTPTTTAFTSGSDPFASSSVFDSATASSSQPSYSLLAADSDLFSSSQPVTPALFPHDPFMPSQSQIHSDPFSSAPNQKQAFASDPFSGGSNASNDPFFTGNSNVTPHSDPFGSSNSAGNAGFAPQPRPAGGNAFSGLGGDGFGQPSSSDPFFSSMGPAAMANDDFFGKSSPARVSTTSSTSAGGFTDDFGISWDHPPATAAASNGKDPMIQLRETYGLQDDERESDPPSADRSRASHAGGASGFGKYETHAAETFSGPMEGRILARHSAVSLLTSNWDEQYWSISQGNLMLFKDEYEVSCLK